METAASSYLNRALTMQVFRDVFGLFFPASCCGCGAALVGNERTLCTDCLLHLPESGQAAQPNNNAEQRLTGYLPFEAAYAHLLFTKRGITQSILHQIKYKGNTQLALLMGRQMGSAIAESHRFDDVDILIPVPLHRRKKWKRGYNQSELLCRGIAEQFDRPICTDHLYRSTFTHSQTHKNRQERLDNMREVFALHDAQELEGKHILLVDDVLTTGATTGACADQLLTIPNIKISIATLAIAGDV